ncbi:DinB family protein [Symbiobacterium thermophilum]|uniref:DinB-like domain-containing protein n=1 Tax=Symbiobacterium thermophilum (strain DSM 24528 / JCM 14929 / IAM 14863 / T) TaxID=292459 RepID=Q67NK5_SYMTH|nr:DinB family protein [Symbiobacterium thermophilum]BAD40738.1 conserved hypothetical protein [Symbiobacterium thermophilum IAM 14863]
MIAEARACSEQLAFGLRTIQGAIRDLTPEQLAFVPPGLANSIATLVLHVAATEVVVAEQVLGRRAAEDLRRAVLLDRYTPAPGAPIPAADPGETAESLIGKLERARAEVLGALEALTPADLERTFPFRPGGRPQPLTFFLQLLPFHIASHYGQIALIKRFLRQDT